MSALAPLFGAKRTSPVLALDELFEMEVKKFVSQFIAGGFDPNLSDRFICDRDEITVNPGAVSRKNSRDED
jgi:hypothetical protein